MDFLYFVGPLLLVIIVAAILLRNRTHTDKPALTRNRAWRDHSASANPFPDTTVVPESDLSMYAAYAAPSCQAPDNSPACSDFSSNYSDSGSAASVCSDSASSTY